jgi:integrase
MEGFVQHSEEHIMPSVFRPSFHSTVFEPASYFEKNGKKLVRFKMPKTGKMVTGEVMKSGKAKIQVQFYYTRIKGKKVALGTADKETALSKAAMEQRRADRGGELGDDDRKVEQRNIPLRDHIANYEAHLRSNGYTAEHIDETVALLHRICAACQFSHIEHLLPVWMNRYLAGIIKAGRSFRTRNKSLHTITALVHYLQDTEVMDKDPFRTIKDLNEDLDPNRRHRRALTAEEFSAIVLAAQSGRVVQGTDGPTRAIIYSLAISTGLRAREIALLPISALVLNTDLPHVALPAAIAKAKRADVLPLHEHVVELLAAHVKGRAKSARVFPTMITANGKMRLTNRMMKSDCKAAKVPYKTDDGFSDFHALRTSFISRVCRLTDQFQAMKLARHTKASITAKHYDKVSLGQRSVVVAGLLPAPAKN